MSNTATSSFINLIPMKSSGNVAGGMSFISNKLTPLDSSLRHIENDTSPTSGSTLPPIGRPGGLVDK
jgi:hypothetical protein